MGAYVEEYFDGGFVLDEAKLRKIHDLITNRITDIPVLFKVFRGDSFSYETESIEDVINEDNEDWRSITKLQLVLREERKIEFKMMFSGNGLSLDITGDDRDSVFLLFSDLREYLKNDVLSRAPLTRYHALTISAIIMALLLAIVIYFVLSPLANKDPSLLHSALETTDLSEKLNYLIEDRVPPMSGNVVYLLILMLFVPLVISSKSVQKIWNFVYPTNLFLFGEKKNKHEARSALIGKIIWGVGVALTVSTLAGFFVWGVTT